MHQVNHLLITTGQTYLLINVHYRVYQKQENVAPQAEESPLLSNSVKKGTDLKYTDSRTLVEQFTDVVVEVLISCRTLSMLCRPATDP